MELYIDSLKIEDMSELEDVLISIVEKLSDIINNNDIEDKLLGIEFTTRDGDNRLVDVGIIRLTYSKTNGEGKFYSLDIEDKSFANNFSLAKHIYNKLKDKVSYTDTNPIIAHLMFYIKTPIVMENK